LTHLLLKLENPDFRRIKCLEYIINFAAKVFLFKTGVDAFKKEFEIKKRLCKLEIVRKLWRKKELFEKFYNTVSFIRRTP
jgi:hypothetical protein